MLNLSLPLIDFKRDRTDMSAEVLCIGRYPKYPIPLAQIRYEDGEIRHILSPIGLRPGDTVLSAENAPLKPGNTLPLKNIPLGVLVHNVEIKPWGGGQLVRSAGSSAQVAEKADGICILHLPSGKTYRVSLECRATVGRVDHVHKHKLKPAESTQADKQEVTETVQQRQAPSRAVSSAAIWQPVAPPIQDDAELRAEPQHITVESGGDIQFTIVAKNSGSTCWTAEGKYQLGWLKGYEHFTARRQLKLELDNREKIRPAMSKSWELVGITAPQPGNYHLVWQMYSGEFNWFGNKLSLQLQVQAGSAVLPSQSTVTAARDKKSTDGLKTRLNIEGRSLSSSTKEEQEVAGMVATSPSPLHNPPPPTVATVPEDNNLEVQSPIVIVKPPIGPAKSRFKVHVTRGTPRKGALLSYQDFTGGGWGINNKKFGLDKNGQASVNISWKKSGTYDVWVTDNISGAESKVARVIVL